MKSIRCGNAKGTCKNHRTHHKAYLRFCEEYKFSPFPADDWRYCQFAQYLAWEDKVPNTCSNYTSTVRHLHRLQRMPCPEPSQVHFRLLTNGLQRQCKKPVKQAEPLTHQTLMQLYPYVDLTQELHVVVWVVLLVGFTLILRVSNIGPEVRKDFDPDQHLLRSDLIIKQGIPTLKIRWTKTLQ